MRGAAPVGRLAAPATLALALLLREARFRWPDRVTVERFDDFELRLEWRISQNGNSGIIYMFDLDREEILPSVSGSRRG